MQTKIRSTHTRIVMVKTYKSQEDRRILFLSNHRICYGAVRPIRSLEVTMEYAGVSVTLQKVSKQSCGKMPKTTTLSKFAMQSFFGQFYQLKDFSVENRSFSQMLPRRFSMSALVRRKSKLRGGAFPGYRRTYYDIQVA